MTRAELKAEIDKDDSFTLPFFLIGCIMEHMARSARRCNFIEVTDAGDAKHGRQGHYALIKINIPPCEEKTPKCTAEPTNLVDSKVQGNGNPVPVLPVQKRKRC